MSREVEKRRVGWGGLGGSEWYSGVTGRMWRVPGASHKYWRRCTALLFACCTYHVLSRRSWELWGGASIVSARTIDAP
jgi:hypothetical protein